MRISDWSSDVCSSDLPASALARTRTSAAEPVNIPAPDTLTDRTPAPDRSSRQPPLSLFVTFTASPLTLSCVVRSPATVAYATGLPPSPTFSRKALPFSALMEHSPLANNNMFKRRVERSSQCFFFSSDRKSVGVGKSWSVRVDMGCGRLNKKTLKYE